MYPHFTLTTFGKPLKVKINTNITSNQVAWQSANRKQISINITAWFPQKFIIHSFPRSLPLQIAVMGLPSPVLIPHIRPSMLVTCQLVWHVRTLRLIVQWIWGIIKYPFARKHITPLWTNPPPTRFHSRVSPPDFPPAVLPRSIAFAKSIQHL